MILEFLKKVGTKRDGTSKIVTRFAPSPTGLLHCGNYRTAVFAYLFARKNGGKFIFRIEDTDRERSKKEYENNIIESLAWLGLDYDEKFVQSERAEIHKKYLKQLVDSGHAYVSKETPKEEGQRAEVIRFKNPNKKVRFSDLIRGEIEFDTTELGDFVIAKSFDEPVFHLAVVVDDHDMGVTHIVRGEDHISNTPRQLLIYEAISAPAPVYAHLPMVLASDRSKLSKRKGAKPVSEYRDLGYLPEALLNFMALIGWSPGDNREIFTKAELVKEFSLERVQKSGAIFNEEKLRFVNKEHLRFVPIEVRAAELLRRLVRSGRYAKVEQGTVSRLIPVVFERIETYGDIDALIANGDFDYYFTTTEYPVEKLLWKNETDWKALKGHFLYLRSAISALPEFPDSESVKAAIWKYAEEKGRGSVLWPLRYSLSGKDKSPDPMTLVSVLGVTESLKRIDHALKQIDSKIP